MNTSESFINGKKILVLDDSEEFLDLIEMWFNKKYDSDVTFFGDYRKLLDADFTGVDALIIDYNLNGGMFAPKVIRKIRKANPDLLIITMSGEFTEDIKSAKETELMLLTLNSGSNRVCTKNLHSLEIILSTHLRVREEAMLVS
jgi:CheY-like chemotaxis protein